MTDTERADPKFSLAETVTDLYDAELQELRDAAKTGLSLPQGRRLMTRLSDALQTIANLQEEVQITRANRSSLRSTLLGETQAVREQLEREAQHGAVKALEVEQLTQQTEQLRVQLSSCATAANDGHPALACKLGDYAWSEAYGDVLRLRRGFEALQERVARMQERPTLVDASEGSAAP